MQKKIIIVGIDEAGRGPLAGEVVAAAVILDEKKPIDGLDDSKKISAKKRNLLFDEIISKAKSYAISTSSVEEIDSLNILQASLLAMKRAVDKLTIDFDKVLVDGNKLPKWNYKSQAIIKGDSKIKEISAASILAKVYRDRKMLELAKEYPQYAFEKHKGYGTQLHLENLRKYGATPLHRKSFRPVRNVL